MKKIILLILIITSLNVYSQSSRKIEKKLKEINTIEQLDKLKNKNPKWKVELIIKNLNDSILDPKIKSLKEGEILTIKKSGFYYTYKLIEIEEEREFRVSHLYLNGKKLSMNEIDSIRTLVIEKYKSGIPFSDLSKKYASYSEPNDGDLGWFKENVMVPKFEKSVKEHKKGDLYLLDIPVKFWYYVVLKTHEDRVNKKMKLIRIKNCS